MQKPQLAPMTTYLSVQNSYTHLEIALMRDAELVDRTACAKQDASRDFIIHLSELLARNKLVVANLQFVAVNQGPGPFTTLRTVLASVNGLSFATNIPLIGVDGLDAGLDELASSDHPINIYLLNAFNRDVYFGIQENHKRQKGYKKIDALLAELHDKHPATPLYFFGNGAELYVRDIRYELSGRAVFADPMPQTCSIEQIGKMGLSLWAKYGQEINGGEREKTLPTQQLMPLYLKQISP